MSEWSYIMSVNLSSKLESGHVYRREDLTQFSKAVDRDLSTLVERGELEKVAAGLYYKPAQSRFGQLPPNENELVASFLKEKKFLLYSWNQYNALGLGLTQLYNRFVVYNHKRHGLFKLAGREFEFKNFARGFPKKLSPEFLLVDLLNNLSELAEDADLVKMNLKKKLSSFDLKKVHENCESYGKVSTKKFLRGICH